MTQLIVRPIDDKRYSKNSQLEYVMMLKNYKSPAYSDALIKFSLDNYHEQMSKAANAFAKRARIAVQAIADAFSKIKANNRQSQGVVHGSEFVVSRANHKTKRDLLDRHYEGEGMARSIDNDGDLVVTINVPN